MKKTLILCLSIFGGMFLVFALVSSVSVMAGDWQTISAPPQPLSAEELVAAGQATKSVEPALRQRVLVASTGTSAHAPELIPNIEPYNVNREGVPTPGEIVTYYYTTTPQTSDGEGIDAYMFFAPAGWEILEISAAPAANNDVVNCFGGPVPGVTQTFTNTGGEQSVAYWGNDTIVTFEPISSTERSQCGPWVADGTTQAFWVKLQVDPDAVTCPGAPSRVGIPWDLEFNWKPAIKESMTMYLYGDGSGGTPTNSTVHTWELQLQQPCPTPIIELEKTATTTTCSEAADEIDAISGQQVTYCYKVLNLNSLVTVTQQTLEDNHLGSFQYEQVIPGGYGWMVALPQTVTGTVGLSITNVATWTALTDPGFGQWPQDAPTATFAITNYWGSSSDTARVNIIEGTLTRLMYLPIIVHNYSSIKPEAGYWSGPDAKDEDFYVTTDQAFVDDFTAYFTVPGCASFELTMLSPIAIQGGQFSADSGGFAFNGTFDSPTSAHGQVSLTNYPLGPCGNVTLEPWNWSASWQNTSQPAASEIASPDQVIQIRIEP